MTIHFTKYWAALLVGIVFCTGCKDKPENQPEAPKPPAVRSDSEATFTFPESPFDPMTQGADQVAFDFFQAVLGGDEETIRSLLTPRARQRGEEQGIPFSAARSTTATFTLDRTEYRGEQGAYVYSTLTDSDSGGVPSRTEIVWLVAQTPEGWRIAGAATVLFEGQEKTVLDFEDPETTRQAIAAAEQRELDRRRRTATGTNPAVRQVSW